MQALDPAVREAATDRLVAMLRQHTVAVTVHCMVIYRLCTTEQWATMWVSAYPVVPTASGMLNAIDSVLAAAQNSKEQE